MWSRGCQRQRFHSFWVTRRKVLLNMCAKDVSINNHEALINEQQSTNM